jgi:type VI protein secretion system component VasF
MSGAASEAAAIDPGAEPLVEPADDSHETRMTYDESSRVPWWVVAVWVCALIGFAGYMVFYMFPDLAKWLAP